MSLTPGLYAMPSTISRDPRTGLLDLFSASATRDAT